MPLEIGQQVRTTVPMRSLLNEMFNPKNPTSNFRVDPPGQIGILARPYRPYTDDEFIVEFSDGSWADYEPEWFEVI